MSLLPHQETVERTEPTEVKAIVYTTGFDAKTGALVSVEKMDLPQMETMSPDEEARVYWLLGGGRD